MLEFPARCIKNVGDFWRNALQIIGDFWRNPLQIIRDFWRNSLRAGASVQASKADILPLACLRLGAFLCFAGWTWAHFYWEAPYGVLLWHDATFELATRLGISWEEFVGSGANDGLVQWWVSRMWWLYLACTLLSLTVRTGAWLQMAGLVMGSGLLVILAYTHYMAALFQAPTFVEYSGQILMPVILVMALALGTRQRVTQITAIIALILTFASHGSYALGLWPTPGIFYAMTSLVLGVEYPTAQALLRAAGAVDLLVCIGICLPYTRRASALYASLWGLLTACARPLAGMSWELNYWGADQFLHEALLRAPHFLIPLYLWLIWRPPRTTEHSAGEAPR